MKKFSYVIMIAGILFSCSDQANQQNQFQQLDSNAASASGTDSLTVNDALEANRKHVEEHPFNKKTENTTSVYRYITSTQAYNLMGELVKVSDYGKSLHSENWTLLTPTNTALQVYTEEVVGAFRYPEAKKLLNEFIAAHIIPSFFSINKNAENTTGDLKLKNLSGEEFTVSKVERTIGGARYSGVEFLTEHGNVISMDQAIDFPEEQLKKILANNTKGKIPNKKKPV